MAHKNNPPPRQPDPRRSKESEELQASAARQTSEALQASSREGWPAPESALLGIRGQKTREELRATLPERIPTAGDGRDVRQESFPEEAEIEYERSVIRIPFYLRGASGGPADRRTEIMVFHAFMRLIREAPIRNGLGLRQFEFYIDQWELANTFSQGLNADVTFTLSDTVQPKSLCISLQRESDFPAMITYNAIYDVYVGSERVIANQPGTAFASPVWSIPPRNVTVAFEKPFESDLFTFSSGTCEGMIGLPPPDYDEGVLMAQRVRGQV